MQKNNDTISDVVLRMTKDSDFFDVVESLYGLDSEKIAGVKQMLSAFLKQFQDNIKDLYIIALFK